MIFLRFLLAICFFTDMRENFFNCVSSWFDGTSILSESFLCQVHRFSFDEANGTVSLERQLKRLKRFRETERIHEITLLAIEPARNYGNVLHIYEMQLLISNPIHADC